MTVTKKKQMRKSNITITENQKNNESKQEKLEKMTLQKQSK